MSSKIIKKIRRNGIKIDCHLDISKDMLIDELKLKYEELEENDLTQKQMIILRDKIKKLNEDIKNFKPEYYRAEDVEKYIKYKSRDNLFAYFLLGLVVAMFILVIVSSLFQIINRCV